VAHRCSAAGPIPTAWARSMRARPFHQTLTTDYSIVELSARAICAKWAS
jgi:hypothetical protein